MLVHFHKILYRGYFANEDYQLVCNGKSLRNSKVTIHSTLYFHHALQCCSSSLKPTPLQPTSVVLITQLQERTSIFIRIDYKNHQYDLKLVVDLNIRRIFIETEERIPAVMLSRLLSCFGIKNGNKILYLASNVQSERDRK